MKLALNFCVAVVVFSAAAFATEDCIEIPFGGDESPCASARSWAVDRYASAKYCCSNPSDSPKLTGPRNHRGCSCYSQAEIDEVLRQRQQVYGQMPTFRPFTRTV